jgi:uncharacterized ferredoxin-like protein
MLTNERTTRNERLLLVANAMMTAARTAPKGKGIDIIEVALASGETIGLLSKAMLEYGERTGLKFITRDALNILQAEAIVLIGTRQQSHGLNCGYCGFESCEAKNEFPAVPSVVHKAMTKLRELAASSRDGQRIAEKIRARMQAPEAAEPDASTTPDCSPAL